MNKYSRALKEIEKNPTEKTARRMGIPIGELISRGLAMRQKTIGKKYIVPKGTPIWASSYKYSRKKYGIEEHITENVILKITDRGRRYLNDINSKSKG